MASSSLANEYRPIRLQDVLGHERHVRGLLNMLKRDKLPSVLLLAGPTGTGKTTLARALAAAAMCPHIDKATLEPCGTCLDCRSVQGVNDGANFMHINGATGGRKETIEVDLAGFLHASTISARMKICIADEAQDITKAALGAMLTMTEEMPGRSMLIMTTTHPQDLAPAILTRCVKIQLAPLAIETMVEGVLAQRPEFAEARPALTLLARHAEGSMRELWTLITKIDSYEEPLTEQLAAWAIGGAATADRAKLLAALDKRDFKKALAVWKQLLDGGATPTRLGTQLLDDLLERAAADPARRDWVVPIQAMARAQQLDTESAWRSALVAMAPHPLAPVAQLDTEDVIQRIAREVAALLPELVEPAPRAFPQPSAAALQTLELDVAGFLGREPDEAIGPAADPPADEAPWVTQTQDSGGGVMPAPADARLVAELSRPLDPHSPEEVYRYFTGRTFPEALAA